MARARLVGAGGISVLAALAVAGLMIIAVATPNRVAWIDLDTGDCVEIPELTGESTGGEIVLEIVTPRDCHQDHDAEVVGVIDLNPDGERPYPDDVDLFAEADRECAAATRGRHEISGSGVLPIVPDRRTWDDRQGRLVCLIAARQGDGVGARGPISAVVASESSTVASSG